MLRFDERVAIVTSGAKGLGREYCRLLGSRGARVVINCLPHEEAEAEANTEEVRSSGGGAMPSWLLARTMEPGLDVHLRSALRLTLLPGHPCQSTVTDAFSLLVPLQPPVTSTSPEGT